MTRRVVLVANPTAGGGRGAALLGPAVERLRRGGLAVDVVTGRSAGEAHQLLAQAVSAGADGVVALGGDGLVNLALQVVAGTGVPMGVVPAGTGNDVARSLGLQVRRPLTGADWVVDGRTRPVDLGRTGDRWFAGVLSAGFDSMVNERANRMTWPRGRSRYNVAMVAELRTLRPMRFSLEVDGVTVDAPAMAIAVGNGPSYGGGMRICPGARLDDGRLDVTVVGPISRAELLRVFPRVYRGTHVSHPAVSTYQSATVVLQGAEVTAYADGEWFHPLPVRCESVPGAWTAFAPTPPARV